MIAEIGHFALILALFVAAAQAVLPAIGAQQDNSALMRFGRRAAVLQCELAAAHSHSAKPLIYKISGVWGNHEGSILLWTLMIGIYSAFFARSKQALPDKLRALTLACQGALSVGFIAFILFT